MNQRKNFVPPIDQDELLRKTRYVVKSKGLENHLEAIIGILVLKEIITLKKSPFPLSDIKIKNIPSWIDTFFLCIAFLKHHNMTITLETIQLELGKNMPQDQNVFDSKLSDEYFSDLFEILPTLKKKDFETKLNSFIEETQYDDAFQLPSIGGITSSFSSHYSSMKIFLC